MSAPAGSPRLVPILGFALGIALVTLGVVGWQWYAVRNDLATEATARASVEADLARAQEALATQTEALNAARTAHAETRERLVYAQRQEELLASERDRARETAAEATARTETLATELQAVQDQLVTVRTALETRQARVASELEAEIARLEAELAAARREPGDHAALPTYASILELAERVIALDVGSADGFRPGQRLAVTAAGESVGSVEIVRLAPKYLLARWTRGPQSPNPLRIEQTVSLSPE